MGTEDKYIKNIIGESKMEKNKFIHEAILFSHEMLDDFLYEKPTLPDESDCISQAYLDQSANSFFSINNHPETYH